MKVEPSNLPQDLADKQQESIQGFINLEEDEPSVVQAMLHYMYKSDYYDNHSRKPDDRSPLLFNLQVFVLADKYQVEGLKVAAAEKIQRILANGDSWTHVDFVPALRMICGDEFPQAQAIRDGAIQVAHDNLDKLLEKDEFIAALNSVAGLGSALTKKLGGNPGTAANGMNQFFCDLCGQVTSMDWPEDEPTGCCIQCSGIPNWTELKQQQVLEAQCPDCNFLHRFNAPRLGTLFCYNCGCHFARL